MFSKYIDESFDPLAYYALWNHAQIFQDLTSSRNSLFTGELGHGYEVAISDQDAVTGKVIKLAGLWKNPLNRSVYEEAEEEKVEESLRSYFSPTVVNGKEALLKIASNEGTIDSMYIQACTAVKILQHLSKNFDTAFRYYVQEDYSEIQDRINRLEIKTKEWIGFLNENPLLKEIPTALRIDHLIKYNGSLDFPFANGTKKTLPLSQMYAVLELHDRLTQSVEFSRLRCTEALKMIQTAYRRLMNAKALFLALAEIGTLNQQKRCCELLSSLQKKLPLDYKESYQALNQALINVIDSRCTFHVASI
jgi:hypothetical protein